jgi:hypothetical protein
MDMATSLEESVDGVGRLLGRRGAKPRRCAFAYGSMFVAIL